MFEVPTSTAHRDAIARAHAERSAAFAAGLEWLRSFFATEPKGAEAASV